MTKEEIIDIYVEVSNKLCNGTEWCWSGVDGPLQLFAKLVAEAEREACAKLCDLAMLQNQEAINELEDIDINITWNENSMRDFGKDELNFARAILRKAQKK